MTSGSAVPFEYSIAMQKIGNIVHDDLFCCPTCNTSVDPAGDVVVVRRSDGCGGSRSTLFVATSSIWCGIAVFGACFFFYTCCGSRHHGHRI